MNRKTTPKVKNGRVQKKNRHELTPNYWNTLQDVLQIDIEKPGKGYKHFLKKRDIIQFLEILPHWEEIETEFKTVFSRGERYAESYAEKYEKLIWNKYFETFKR